MKLPALLTRSAWAAAALLVGVGTVTPAQAQMKQNWMYASSVPAHAQKPAFPIKDKAIRVVLAFPPGSMADAQARAVGAKMAEMLGVPVVIENRPERDALPAAQEVLSAMPDGHTLFYSASSTMALAPHVSSAATFEPVNEFAQISLAAKSPLMLLAGPAVPVRNVAELIAYGKANPGKLRYASSGVGSESHVLAETLAMNTGIAMVHVPDDGRTDTAGDLAGGRIHLVFEAAPVAVQTAKSGRAKLLAVAAPLRSPLQPNLPTFAEQGVNDVDLTGFVGWYAPGGVRPETVAALHVAIAESLEQASVQEVFSSGGHSAESSTPQALTAMVKAAYDAWGNLVRRIGMTKQ